MAKGKKDLSALLDKVKETQVNTPVQKVVPVVPELPKKEKSSANDNYRLNLRMYIKEYEDLVTFINYMIIEEKNLNYVMSDAISKGIHLLSDNPAIKRGMPETNLTSGRKDQTTVTETKGTTVIISIEEKELLNDFIYHKRITEGIIKYSRVDLMADLMDAIRKKYKNCF